MDIELVINTVLIIALVGFLGFRQLNWRPVVVGRLWRLPLIIGAIGVFSLGQTLGASTLSGFEIGLLAVELVISLAVGSVMGVIAQFRIRAATAADGSGSRGGTSAGSDTVIESRTGWWGLGLWALFIALRVGMDIWAGEAGSALAASTAIILIMVAANRLARAAVVALRLGQLQSVVAQ